jgi:hypothetical protein
MKPTFLIIRQALISMSFLFITLEAKNNLLQNNKNIRINHRKATSVRRQEDKQQLCPLEYQQSCWCDYSNLNPHEVLLSFKSNNNNQKVDNSSQISSLSSSNLISIDCQFYINNKNKNNQNNFTMLKKVPRIESASRSNSMNKLKHLNQFTHIDLSRTEITEVPEDAFKVNRNIKTTLPLKLLESHKIFCARGH